MPYLLDFPNEWLFFLQQFAEKQWKELNLAKDEGKVSRFIRTSNSTGNFLSVQIVICISVHIMIRQRRIGWLSFRKILPKIWYKLKHITIAYGKILQSFTKNLDLS